MPFPIHFSGPVPYQVRNALALCSAVPEVLVRRKLRGPRRPGWNFYVELGTEILKKELNTVFKMGDVNEARCYLDSFVITSPVLSQVTITPVGAERYKGSWFIPKNACGDHIVLYFHGGGYSFYSKSYTNFIAEIAVATKSKTLALDYRLSPEHRFPAQLEDALQAYRCLLEGGADPSKLIIAGDSAGGNLTLALLLAARDSRLPLPALAVVLSPAVDVENEYPSMIRNEPYDWIQRRMVLQWADWFCQPAQRRNPLVSPLFADLRGLPPVYIQAGRCEILFDAIQQFADRARSQGADVVLETWDDMNHVFQLFGQRGWQSAEALQRLGKVIEARMRNPQEKEDLAQKQNGGI